MMRAAKCLLLWITTVVIGISGEAPSGWAETAYIVDTIKIALRSGPGNDQKTLGMAESGNPVEVLKPGEEWSLVRLGNGTEGYLLSRYLTATPPARFRLDQLQEKNKTLNAQAAGLLEENNRLKAENEKLAAAVSAGQKEVAALHGEFDAFRQEVADVTALKSRNDELAAELDKTKRDVARLESGPLMILQNENFYWFLAGAAVLLAGFLAGYSVKRSRRWSTLS
jgi:SH3 domain protein